MNSNNKKPLILIGFWEEEIQELLRWANKAKKLDSELAIRLEFLITGEENK